MPDSSKTVISTAPFLHDRATTPRIMWEVVFSMAPILLAGYYYFGLSAVLVTAVCVLDCLLAEWVFDTGAVRGASLRDGSALITGMLLAFTLPPGFPLWMAFVGGFVAIGMGKAIWGGLGQNIFNPALVGRAFLQAAFPGAITTWELPDGQYFSGRGANFALPFMKGEPVDGVSAATPLANMKFSHAMTPWQDLFLGNTSGCIGETSALLILLAGAFLVYRKLINWRIPVSILVTVALLSALIFFVDPQRYPPPHFMLLAGGLLLGAVFMATDMVTSPLTGRGIWIYGTGIGALVVTIRIWGGLPEGVMYAILLMNAVTPLINKYVKQRVYGHA